MTKQRNWDVRLVQWAREQIGKEFVWGETDCGSLAKQACGIMYGEDIFDTPGYTTKTGAVRAYNQIENFARCLLDVGAYEVGTGFMQIGDIVLGEELENGLGTSMVAFRNRKLLYSTPDEGVSLKTLMSEDVDVFHLPYELKG